MREFKILPRYDLAGLKLPERKTKFSAGYDFYAAEDVEILPKSVAMIPTGIKCYMEQDEFLMLAIRSSLAISQGLMLANSVGIVDADYCDNVDNEGHIVFVVYNTNDMRGYVIKKGDRIGQGIFVKYGKVDVENEVVAQRKGVMGSTGK